MTGVLSLAALGVTTGLWVAAAVLAGLNGELASAGPGLASVAFAAVGVLVVWQRPGHRLGPLFCAAGVVLALMGASQEYARRTLLHAPGSLPSGTFAAWLSDLMAPLTVGLIAGLLPQLFPTGRPLSRRWRLPVWAAAGFVVFAAVGNAFTPQDLESVPHIPNPYGMQSAEAVFGTLIGLATLCGAIALVAGVAALVTRWRRSRGEERQQLKWFLAGIAPLPIPVVLHSVAPGASDAAISIVLVVVPVTMGVAILRYRLYDLDLAVNRTVVYATLTAAVALAYLAVVGLGEIVVGGEVTLAGHVVAAVVAAEVLQSMRGRVQQGVDRLFYGDRSRPYDVVARLGRGLERAVVPDTVLLGVVETVADALRLPYVAIELRDGDRWTMTAEHGHPVDGADRFPMVYQADSVGRLVVGRRGGGEPFAAADRRLLEDLARQAGVAAHAVQTTTALLRSRAELVTAREEERRRLRRDLHDGLGPALAGVTLGLHAARVQVRRDPDQAETLLAGIEGQIEDAVTDIRRLVYGLRPPALDEFGLVRAVQLHATRMEGTEGLAVAIDAPSDGLGPLPAAVEVAAYRIATEALTNVVRHANAERCTVRLAHNGALEVEITDDGHGLDPLRGVGVGLTAMRERAAELGGTVTIESSETGTRVLARLPTPEER